MSLEADRCIEVLLIDDHRLVAEGISSLLADPAFIASIGADTRVESVFSVQRACDLIDADRHFDLILLDLSLPGMNGFDFLGLLRERELQIPVIVLSASNSTPDMLQARDLGARGFICKFESAQEMLAKIGAVIQGAESFPEAIQGLPRSTRTSAAASGALTPRQFEVLELIAAGKSNKQISTLLGVSLATVKFHVAELFRQLGVQNRTMCVREALRRNLIGAGTVENGAPSA